MKIYYKPNSGIIVYACDGTLTKDIELPYIELSERIDISNKKVNLQTMKLEDADPITPQAPEFTTNKRLAKQLVK